ncbi:MAG: hypothetical protein QOD00_2436 [Blastocatellia bacterium]|jgi:predicted ATPase|nr:hypothetical protein [Blastocatellia bacterium]
MIKSVHFKNFKVLQNVVLPLSPFTLIVGPNGSGKTTAMQALQMARTPKHYAFSQVVTAGVQYDIDAVVEIKIDWHVDNTEFIGKVTWLRAPRSIDLVYGPTYSWVAGEDWSEKYAAFANEQLKNFKIFAFDAKAISAPVTLHSNLELQPDGTNLAGVLDNIRDVDPERFEELNNELGRWLPEFDRILFESPLEGKRALMLRTRIGKHRIRASELSQGTLFALAFLTLAYLPQPPSIVCFEEAEHGIHPRLLVEIRDAMYRLCYPKDYGEKRDPVQVIATTHSPYLLDLYKDHPEEIVIANKDAQGIQFERLSEKPDISEFLQDAPLSEVWYSGVLGGVPLKP